MPRAGRSEGFKEQVVREVIDKERSISSMAASYGLVAQTAGNWVAKHGKERGSAEEREAVAEAEEVARLKKQVREPRQGCEFLKKAAVFFAKNDR